MRKLESTHIIIRILLPVLWYGFIFYLTELPEAGKDHTLEAFRVWTDHTLQDMTGQVDTLALADTFNYIFRSGAHMFVFGVLGILLYFLVQPELVFRTSVYWGVVVGVVLLGLLDEIHQSFVPGRHPRLEDIIKDTLGCITMVYMLLFVLKYRRRNTPIPV